MRHRLNALLAVVVIAALVAVSAATNATAQHGPDATPRAVSLSTGAAYMVIENTGTTADRLIGGMTAVAETVEIHEVVNESGVMKMQPLAEGLEIPAGEAVELKPGGYHVMLIGLTESLVEGATYELTLTFENAGDVVLTVPIFADATAAAEATPVPVVVAGEVAISGVWSRPAPALDAGTMAGASAAAFMTIVNTGEAADTLVAARSDIAMTAEIHEVTQGDGGVMRMSPLADGLEIPAGGSVTLEPGGYHVMLIGITQDLTPGFTYELTLTFAEAGDVTITVPVQTAAPSPDASEPVTVGTIEVSGQWSRPAPAMTGNGNGMNGNGMATPTPGM